MLSLAYPSLFAVCSFHGPSTMLHSGDDAHDVALPADCESRYLYTAGQAEGFELQLLVAVAEVRSQSSGIGVTWLSSLSVNHSAEYGLFIVIATSRVPMAC